MICTGAGRAQLVLEKTACGDSFPVFVPKVFLGTCSTCFALANIEFANFVCSQLQSGMTNPVILPVLG